MKNIFMMFVLLAIAFSTSAQSISRSAISSAGGTLSGGSNQLTYTIGETMIPTLTAAGNTLTQGFQQPGEQIRTGTVPTSICRGNSILIPYNAIDIGSGNTFTAELSDATGSFASPLILGTTTGNGSGNINVTIPVNTPNGNAYRIRVTGSSPLVKGADNGADISISEGAAPTVAGITNVCPYVGNLTAVTFTAAATGAGSYTWTVPPNVNIVSGAGTANLTVTFAAGFTAQVNKQIRVTATSACGVSPQTVHYLASQAPTTAQPIVAGSNNICSVIGTAGTITYTIPAVPGAGSYIWSAQAGNTIISHPNGAGMNDTTVTVSFTSGFTTSSITVQAVNDCGAGAVRSLLLTRANPSTPGLISGPSNACPYISPDGVAATYSVVPVANAASYTWTVPANVIGLTGQGTNSISFIYPPGFTSGNVSVTATNGCGTSTARSLQITRLNPATPSVIDVIQTQFCPTRVYTYTLASMPANATSVQWTVPAAAISFTGQGTSSIAVVYPSTAVSGTVTAQALNNCGSSTIRSSAVKLAACPPADPLMAKGSAKATAIASVEAIKVETFQATVFPNPSISDFKLKVVTAGPERITVRVLDVSGRMCKQFTVMPHETTGFGADLKAGTYMIEVKQGGNVKTIKVVKF
ncbi:MAG: T9SS type A sorting domain-containing protein [Ferruginibacter sp.]